MDMELFKAVRKTLKSKPFFVKELEGFELTDNDDWYTSLYLYKPEHLEIFKLKNTISGITDTITKQLYFDFDSKEDLENARKDALTLVSRLESQGISKDNYRICWTGNKGFSVEVPLEDSLSPIEFKALVNKLAGDLRSFDTVVSDSNRVIRVTNSKHQQSGLYKIPLSKQELELGPIDDIKTMAKSPRPVFKEKKRYKLNDELVQVKENANVKPKKENKYDGLSLKTEIDWSKKPKWMMDQKYALQLGYFDSGERNEAFMILCSTYKNQGFPEEMTYRMLKGVNELQSRRTGQPMFSNDELWYNITKVIYGTTWQGGQYAYDKTPLLQKLTERLHLKPPKEEEVPTLLEMDSLGTVFRNFAVNIDKNTIKLGFDEIDQEVQITTSMLVYLLAAPSAGKSSISFSILNHSSKNNIKTIFFSLDMGMPLVYQRLMQKHTGMTSKTIFNMYKEGDKRVQELEDRVVENYKNVKFCFRSGLTVDDIENYIKAEKDATGEYPKLVVIDYLECITGPFSDSTANSAYIANRLKDIANQYACTVLLLVQPQKQAGDPSAELLSMRNVKGSSVLEQAASVILTLSRPGFNPKDKDNDKFAMISCVKNRMGQLGTWDFTWNGLTGQISTLEDEDRVELENLRKKKADEKKEEL